MMSIHEQDKLIEGMDKGRAIGITIGKAEVIAIGQAKALRSVAINMNREGLPLDTIARIVHENPKVIQTWIEEESRV